MRKHSENQFECEYVNELYSKLNRIYTFIIYFEFRCSRAIFLVVYKLEKIIRQ